MQIFGVTNKEHYGMLWYLLEWSIVAVTPIQKADNHEQYKDYCNLHSSKSPL